MAFGLIPAVLGFAYMLVFSPWRLERLRTFLDPWRDPQGKSYHIVQSLLSFGSGGWHGVGFGEGKQKLDYLPYPYADSIFAVIGEELGLVGCVTVIVLFGIFLWRGLRASLNAPDRFGMLLGVALVTNIFGQAMFNMSVALALVPNKGIPLPFISAGGSSLLPTMIAVGLLLSISQYAGVPDMRESGRGGEKVKGRSKPGKLRTTRAWAR
jgi:cell division protein FtsW